jgi:hypothetical protein
MVRLYEAGFLQSEVARKLNRPHSTVRGILRRAGIQIRPLPGGVPRIPHNEFDLVRRLYEDEGLSQREIANLLSMSTGQVHHRRVVAGVGPHKSASLRRYWASPEGMARRKNGSLWAKNGQNPSLNGSKKPKQN